MYNKPNVAESIINPIIHTNKPLKNTKCRLSEPQYPILEENLGCFLYLCQKKLGIVYTGPFIQAQAILMFEELQEVGSMADPQMDESVILQIEQLKEKFKQGDAALNGKI